MRFLLYDLKRMFSGKALVFLCLLSPIIVVFIFSTVVSPMIFTARGVHFNLAICNEDKSDTVNEFIKQLINSQALVDIITVYPVQTVEQGIALIDSGDISVMIHIPSGLFENMTKGKEVKVTVYSTKAHSFETNLVSMTLNSSLSVVGKSQNIMEAARTVLVDKGETEENAQEFLDDSTNAAIDQFMSRRDVLGNGGALSPVGEYLPIEYYLSAIFSLFAALAMLPIIHFSAVDCQGSILKRGLLCGIGTARFFSARILSGTIFVALVLLMLFPASLLLRLGGQVLGGIYASRLSALVVTIILSSVCFSALALAIATWLPKEKTALWTGFFLALLMAVFCGALIPEGALPKLTLEIGKWLPLRSVMRMLSVSLFDYNRGIFLQDVCKSSGFTAVFLALGFLGLRRRGRAA